MALQDRLINLCFQSARIASGRMQRSEKCRCARQVALGLRIGRLLHKNIQVVGYNIEDLVQLSERIRKLPAYAIGLRMLREQAYISRVELLGVFKIILAVVPLAAPACDIGQQLRNAATIGQVLTGSLKI